LAGPNYINLKVATPSAIDSELLRETAQRHTNSSNEGSVRKESIYE